jgi:hypothetical protein
MATVLQDIREAAHKSQDAQIFRWETWRPLIPGRFKQGRYHYSVSLWCPTCGEKRSRIYASNFSERSYCELCGGVEPVAMRFVSTVTEMLYEA